MKLVILKLKKLGEYDGEYTNDRRQGHGVMSYVNKSKYM